MSLPKLFDPFERPTATTCCVLKKNCPPPYDPLGGHLQAPHTPGGAPPPSSVTRLTPWPSPPQSPFPTPQTCRPSARLDARRPSRAIWVEEPGQRARKVRGDEEFRVGGGKSGGEGEPGTRRRRTGACRRGRKAVAPSIRTRRPLPRLHAGFQNCVWGPLRLNQCRQDIFWAFGIE